MADTSGGRWKLIYFWAIVVAVIVGGGVALWRAKWGTYHFVTVDPGVLYRDGNRGEREFCHALERGRIRTVVNLVDDGELADKNKPELGAEMGWCAARGVRVERVPIPLGGWPTSDDVRKFLALVADKRDQPVLVHCAQGVRRTGMMVAAYERSVLGWDALRCKAEMQTFGHSSRTVGDVERFIDVYDPVSGVVPEGLPVGKE